MNAIVEIYQTMNVYSTFKIWVIQIQETSTRSLRVSMLAIGDVSGTSESCSCSAGPGGGRSWDRRQAGDARLLC